MEPRYLQTRQGIGNRVISANNMSDKKCVVVGRGTKEYGTRSLKNFKPCSFNSFELTKTLHNI